MSKLNVNRGTTFTITFNYKKDGVAASLVGATLFFTVKALEYTDSSTDADAVISKTITSHTDAAHGISTIVLAPADTATLAPRKYHYDLKVKESGGSIYKVDEGTFVLDASPTNRMA